MNYQKKVSLITEETYVALTFVLMRWTVTDECVSVYVCVCVCVYACVCVCVCVTHQFPL